MLLIKDDRKIMSQYLHHQLVGGGGSGRGTDCPSGGPGFQTTCCRLKMLAILFTPLCLRISEEAVKAVGPFYLEGNKRSNTLGGGINV